MIKWVQHYISGETITFYGEHHKYKAVEIRSLSSCEQERRDKNCLGLSVETEKCERRCETFICWHLIHNKTPWLCAI